MSFTTTASNDGFYFTEPPSNTGGDIYTITLPNTNGTWEINDGDTLTADTIRKFQLRIKELEDQMQQLVNEKNEKDRLQYSNKDGTNKEWYNVKDMLNDIRAHIERGYGSEIIPADSPRELKIGFVCSSSGKCWEIHLSMVKSTPQEMYIINNKSVMIPDAFQTLEGKMALIDMLNTK